MKQREQTIGRLANANRDAVLFQAVSIELLLRNAIDARPNSSLPELQDILNKIQELGAMLATTTSELDVGAKALSLNECVLAGLAKDHVSILDLGCKSSLFVLLMGLIVLRSDPCNDRRDPDQQGRW
jgi:hypothetical protein